MFSELEYPYMKGLDFALCGNQWNVINYLILNCDDLEYMFYCYKSKDYDKIIYNLGKNGYTKAMEYVIKYRNKNLKIILLKSYFINKKLTQKMNTDQKLNNYLEKGDYKNFIDIDVIQDIYNKLGHSGYPISDEMENNEYYKIGKYLINNYQIDKSYNVAMDGAYILECAAQYGDINTFTKILDNVIENNVYKAEKRMSFAYEKALINGNYDIVKLLILHCENLLSLTGGCFDGYNYLIKILNENEYSEAVKVVKNYKDFYL